MQIDSYFEPVPKLHPPSSNLSTAWGQRIDSYTDSFPDLAPADIALFTIGVSDKGVAIREALYALQTRDIPFQLADLGHFPLTAQQGKKQLSDVSNTIFEENITPIFIAQSPLPQQSIYNSLRSRQHWLNLTHVNESIPLETQGQGNYLNKMILETQSPPLHYSHLAYQNYYVPLTILKALEEHYYDHYRLGALRDNFHQVEAVLRGTHLLSFSLQALRQSEAPACATPSPNGLYAEEACQIARYAGLSHRLKGWGLVDYLSQNDSRQQTAQLLAQMIWYFVEGYYHRQHETPLSDKSHYVKYNVNLEQEGHELVFWKSKKSGRWWMEVPFPTHQKGSHIMPCTYEDYQLAHDGKLPERWLKTYQRLSYVED
jgi:hypothetical protein